MGPQGDSIPLTDLNSVTVPGACAAWIDAVTKFGSKQVTIPDILAPAIQLAEEGCVMFCLPGVLECMPKLFTTSVPVSEIHSHAASVSPPCTTKPLISSYSGNARNPLFETHLQTIIQCY